MTGPWEQYQAAGPWTKYAATQDFSFDPVRDMSAGQRLAAGAGKAFVDTVRGAGQLLGLTSGENVAEARRLDKPLMDTGMGITGNVLGNVAMLLGAPATKTLKGAAAVGSLLGLIQPAVDMTERAMNVGLGAAGGAAGQAIANRIGSMVTQAGTQTTMGQKAAAKAGKDLGMRLTPGKASGSTVLQKFEAAAESNPLTASGFDAIKEQNQQALNRAAAKAIGESSDELSTPILQQAETRLGAVFDSIKDKTPVPFDPKIAPAKLQSLVDDFEGMIGGNASLADNALIKRLDDFVFKGGATREQLRTLSSKLGKAAKTNMTTQSGDRELGQALFQAQEMVEDAIQGSLAPAQQAAYSEARQQYRQLMNLTGSTNIVNPSSGQVSGRNLANSLMRKDKGGFTMGRNESDMYNAARFYQAFPDIVGNSGTATRSMGPTDYVTGLPGNLLMRLYLSQPVTSAASAGAGAVGTAARLGNRPANMLARPVGAASGLTLADLLQQ